MTLFDIKVYIYIYLYIMYISCKYHANIMYMSVCDII